MKRIFFVAAFVALTSTFAIGQQSNAKLEAKLIQMDRDWTAAELRGDTKAAGMVVADDFWGTQPDGTMQNKTQYLKELKATKDTDVADEYSVRFFGADVAVMTHRGTVTGEKPLQYRSTHVWVNRGGKWQIVSHHSSEVAAAASPVDKAAVAPAAKPATSPAVRKGPKIAPSTTAAPTATDEAPTKP